MTMKETFWKGFTLTPALSHQRLCRNGGKCLVCHSEPFAYRHSDPERSEGEESLFSAQGKLHEESHRINKLQNRDSSANASE